MEIKQLLFKYSLHCCCCYVRKVGRASVLYTYVLYYAKITSRLARELYKSKMSWDLNS